MPPLNPNWFQIDPWILIVAAIIVAIILVPVVIWSVRAHQQQILAGREEMVGKTAVVDTPLTPKGVVFIDGERWTAISEEGQVKAEEEVIVTRVQGLKLYVKKISKEVNR
ncbi:NfeD family protein [Chloroflexota bacterium]